MSKTECAPFHSPQGKALDELPAETNPLTSSALRVAQEFPCCGLVNLIGCQCDESITADEGRKASKVIQDGKTAISIQAAGMSVEHPQLESQKMCFV